MGKDVGDCNFFPDLIGFIEIFSVPNPGREIRSIKNLRYTSEDPLCKPVVRVMKKLLRVLEYPDGPVNLFSHFWLKCLRYRFCLVEFLLCLSVRWNNPIANPGECIVQKGLGIDIVKAVNGNIRDRNGKSP